MIYQIIILLLLTGVKAIFSAADTAFTCLNRAEIVQLSKKDKKAEKIRILMENSNRFFGIIEVGINMSELIASAYASMTIVMTLAGVIAILPIPTNIALLIASVLITIILSYILLVFGGVLPKKIARNNPKKVAYKIIPILWVIAKLNHPFETLIQLSDKVFSRLLKIEQLPQEKLTEKQLKMIITEARDEGVVTNIEKRILVNALKVNDISVEKIMIPMEKVICLNIDANGSDILENIKQYKYTRMPVYRDSITNIVGIFNSKDLVFQYAAKGIIPELDLKELLRKPKFINKDENIFLAFKKLQETSQVIAIVVDEKNIPIGIISIEDILEKLVGKIFDEYDKRNS